MAIDDNIKEFCSYFRRQVDVIDSIKTDESLIKYPSDFQALLYKEILLITLLDSMASLRFSKKKYPELNRKNQERFIRFVRDYGEWNDGELISIPFLLDRLSKKQKSTNKLRDHVNDKLSNINTQDGGLKIASVVDEESCVLLMFSTSEDEEKAIFECKHYSILYRYRNYLIHEARRPGNSFDFYGKDCACYQSYIEDDKWYLIYPLGLLKKICQNCVNGLEKYILDNQIDPYSNNEDLSRF